MPGITASSRRRSQSEGEARVVRSNSPEQTERLGRRLGRDLPIPGVVLLCGSLGSGKTTLARGIARGLGLRDAAAVHSPSFTIVNIYHGRCPIYHVDLYRLAGEHDLSSVGLEDFVGRDGVTIVEWGDRLLSGRDEDVVVDLEDAGGESRILHISKKFGCGLGRAGKSKRR